MLATLGDLNEDVVIWLEDRLRRGDDNAATVHRVRGGSAANVAACAAAIRPTRFIGRVGADGIGDALVERMRRSGVDLRVERGGSTGTILVLIEGDAERTMIPSRGAALDLGPVPDEWLAGVELLHVPAYSLHGGRIAESALDALRRTGRAGAMTSIDASSSALLTAIGVERFAAMLASLAPTFLIANEDEAATLRLDADPDALTAACPTTTFVLKHGAAPTRILRRGAEPVVVPVEPVAVVRDSTGAGDAFAAGFLTAVLEDPDLVRACRRGHGLAAEALSVPGASQ